MNRDNGSQAIGSLIIGALGMILWLIPVVGFSINILGSFMGILGLDSNKKSIAKAGLILNGFGILLVFIRSAGVAFLV